MLLAIGEIGYTATSIDDALARTKHLAKDFHRHFGDKDECFERAYEIQTDLLYEQLISTARSQGGWIEGMRAALATMLDFTAEQPLLAKALVLEVHSVRGGAQAKRERFLRRLSQAVDSARREPGGFSEAPPLTASLIVGGVEASIFALLADDGWKTAPTQLGKLLYISALAFFGEDAAREAHDRWS